MEPRLGGSATTSMLFLSAAAFVSLALASSLATPEATRPERAEGKGHRLMTTAIAGGLIASPGDAVSRTETVPGLAKVVFETPEGTVTAHFPDDLRAGDTVSGAVVVEPSGDSEKRRRKNRDRLDGMVVEMAGQKNRVEHERAKWTVPATSATALVVRLVDRHGGEVARTGILVQPAPPHEFATVPGVKEDVTHLVLNQKTRLPPSPDDYRLPSAGQAGRSVTCDGPFDGDLDTTTVTVDGRPARLLAESPRKLVLESPHDATGKTVLKLRERGVECTGAYRSIKVELSAPATRLQKGETTTLGIRVKGLEGITEDVPLEVQKAGVVSMSGGDRQIISIKPSDVGAGGACAYERTLTGLAAGGFDVVASVKMPEPVIRLTKPADGSAVTVVRPSFAWTVEYPPAGVTYGVKVVVGVPGQPLEDAILGPPHYVGRDIESTTWTYPAEAPPLKPGASYAVMVKGIREGAAVAFSNPAGFHYSPGRAEVMASGPLPIEPSRAGGGRSVGPDEAARPLFPADARRAADLIISELAPPPGSTVTIGAPVPPRTAIVPSVTGDPLREKKGAAGEVTVSCAPGDYRPFLIQGPVTGGAPRTARAGWADLASRTVRLARGPVPERALNEADVRSWVNSGPSAKIGGFQFNAPPAKQRQIEREGYIGWLVSPPDEIEPVSFAHKDAVVPATIARPAGWCSDPSIPCLHGALVVDGGDMNWWRTSADNFASDAEKIGEWLGDQGFQVQRVSQYWGNGHPYIPFNGERTPAEVLVGLIAAWGAYFANQPVKGDCACHDFFLYVGAHSGPMLMSPDGTGGSTSIAYDSVFKALDGLPSNVRIWVFFDACRSGFAIDAAEKHFRFLEHCGLTLIWSADKKHDAAMGEWNPAKDDSATQDFLERSPGDHGDGIAGSILNRAESVQRQGRKDYGSGYRTWP